MERHIYGDLDIRVVEERFKLAIFRSEGLIRMYYVGDLGTVMRPSGRKLSGDVIRIIGTPIRRSVLVAMVWIGRPHENARVRFINGDSSDVRVANMEYPSQEK